MEEELTAKEISRRKRKDAWYKETGFIRCGNTKKRKKPVEDTNKESK